MMKALRAEMALTDSSNTGTLVSSKTLPFCSVTLAISQGLTR